jgi:hypothetical protein
MTILATARFLSLDSSVLSDIARDYFSVNANRRNLARAFIGELGDRGWTILFCWHQFAEMIKHRDSGVASSRVQFIRSLPFLAWIATKSHPPDIGSIVDVLVSEVAAAIANPTWQSLEIRDAVKRELLRFGTGDDALRPCGDAWFSIRPKLWEQEARQREISSISQAATLDRSDEPLSNLLDGSVRTVAEARRNLNVLGDVLKQELQERGDRRLPDLDQVIASFLTETFQSAGALNDGKAQPIDRFLGSLGIERGELNPGGKLNEILELAHFRQQLRIAAEKLMIPWETLCRSVSMERIPSWVVQRAVRRHRALAAEAQGGDLTDNYLLCLGLYADLTVVDKRTKENHRRASQKEPGSMSLLNRIERVSNYEAVLELVRNVA